MYFILLLAAFTNGCPADSFKWYWNFRLQNLATYEIALSLFHSIHSTDDDDEDGAVVKLRRFPHSCPPHGRSPPLILLHSRGAAFSMF